jgi:hypothetical protein
MVAPTPEWMTETALAQARVWWDEGMVGSEIARRLGVTTNAFLGKKSRIPGWPKRPSPIKPRLGGPLPRVPSLKNASEERRMLGAAPLKSTLEPQQVASLGRRPAKAAEVKAPANPVFSVFRDCQFPLNDGRPWRFCEAATKLGSAYCPTHHASCHTRHVEAAPLLPAGRGW